MGFVLGISLILNIILILLLVNRDTNKTRQETIKPQEELKELVNEKFNLVIEAMKSGFDVTDKNFNKLGKSISKIEKDIFSVGAARLNNGLKQTKETLDKEEDVDNDKRSSVSKLTFVDRWIEENVNKSKEFEDNVYKMFKHKSDEMYNEFLDYGMLYKVVKFCKEIEKYVYASFTKEDGEFLNLILKTKDLDMEDVIMVDRMYGLDEYGNESHLYSYVISNFENHVKMYECYLEVRENVLGECRELVEHNKGLMGPMNFE